MKKLLLLLCCLGSITMGHSQEYKSSYFGVKIGVNHSTNTYGPEIAGIETSFKNLGFAGGVFYNAGLGQKFSIQPELLYSIMGSDIEYKTANLSTSSILKLHYLSIPVLVKYSPIWRLGFFAGPQLDFLLEASNKFSGEDKVSQDDNFDLYDFAGTLGAEFWITPNIGVSARYIAGLNNVFDQSSPSWVFAGTDVDEIKNHGWQFGLTIGLRTKKKSEPVAVAPAPVPPAPVAPKVVDTDGDGIADANDSCPNVKGISKYNGCPIPDTDGDGVNDEMDKCPKTAGLSTNMGCPELIVYFQRAEAGLTDDDKVSLDKVVTFMNNNPELNIIVEGHTSTLGESEFNQKLSEKRAAESVDYLISKGISASRMTSIGYGEQFPIGDNSIEEGRAKSRRIVMKIAQ